MANEHQSVGKCRFYIDSTQYNRALGNVNANQDFTDASNDSIGINANEMFSNNPSTLWSTDYNGAWMDSNYIYTYNDEFGTDFYYTDYACKFANYESLNSINYIMFLGHNFGDAKTWVEPFAAYYNNSGLETYSNNRTRTTISPSDHNNITDLNDGSHAFINCSVVDDNKIGFFNIDQTNYEFFNSCTLEGVGSYTYEDWLMNNSDNDADGDGVPGTTDDFAYECVEAGGVLGESDLLNEETYTGTLVGWGLARFNDNNNANDSFRGIWASPDDDGHGNYGTRHNTLGLRFYEHHSGARVPNLNAVSMGWTYVLNNTPDLDLELSFEYDGIDKKEGMRGQNFININYDRGASWPVMKRNKDGSGVNANWDIIDMNKWSTHSSAYSTNPAMAHNGRRVWKLKFSYMDAELNSDAADEYGITANKGLLPNSFHSSYYPAQTWKTDIGWTGMKNNFFTRVINGTMGGRLPFIFQPNIEEEKELYLCEFDTKEMVFTQRAHKVYDISLVIREVW